MKRQTRPPNHVPFISLCLLFLTTEEIHFVDTPSLQIAQEHKGTLIRCRAEGDPVPKISWYFNGVSLNGNNIPPLIPTTPVLLAHP